MEQKIKAKEALLYVLDMVEDRLKDVRERAEACITDTDLTPDEEGWVAPWKVTDVENAKRRVEAVEAVRAVLAKLI